MTHTVFQPGTKVTKEWLNDVDKLTYTWFGNGTSLNAGATPSTTTLTASTSVVTPLVSSSGNLTLNVPAGSGGFLQGNSVNLFEWDAVPRFIPSTDNVASLGQAAFRWANIFTPIIDSGSTGSLSLKTNNGTTQVEVFHVPSAVNQLRIQGGTAGNTPIVKTVGSDAAIGMTYGTKGAAGHTFFTDDGGSGATQFQILNTASATRNITVTGSNGGNPVLNTTAGNISAPCGILPQFESAETAIGGANTNTTVAHGLSVVPRQIYVCIRNKTAELGYSIGDEVQISTGWASGSVGLQIYADATNVGILQAVTSLAILTKNTQVSTNITLANWKYVVRTYK